MNTCCQWAFCGQPTEGGRHRETKGFLMWRLRGHGPKGDVWFGLYVECFANFLHNYLPVWPARSSC